MLEFRVTPLLCNKVLSMFACSFSAILMKSGPCGHSACTVLPAGCLSLCRCLHMLSDISLCNCLVRSVCSSQSCVPTLHVSWDSFQSSPDTLIVMV
jgi:hypothetical protein